MIIVLLLLSGLLLLCIGGDLLVRGAESLAIRLGMTQLVIGLTVVAFGTSAPELFISIGAALQDLDDVAIGNAVGSNIANLTLVLGLAACVFPIRVETQVLKKDAPILIICSLALCIMLYVSGMLTRGYGALMVLALITYISFCIRWGRSDKLEPEDSKNTASRSLTLSVFLVVIGLVMLVYGADFFVDGAVQLARMIGISEAIISLTLIALGTSLPEIASTLIASLKGRGDLAIGNAIGSSIFNILAILGLTSLITPLSMGNISWVDLAFMTCTALVVLPIFYTGNKMTRPEGAFMVFCYFAYLSIIAYRIS
ncbi:MAG: calcium/sodium antiporter [Gammaproteobacteria bacterium]|nr:calcium/sodium antiporter [Gammaproteobacteria bacterium]MCY4219461.1 calcium/sodium antiporter [Gammaproteobacteria bacterium]MCY4275335.1 calcium/sodium antiporter [Gammaproteobacteria bacterium]